MSTGKGIARLVLLGGGLAIGLYFLRASPRDVTLVYDFGRAPARVLEVDIGKAGQAVRHAEFRFPSGAPGQVVHRVRLTDGQYSVRLNWQAVGSPRTLEKPISVKIAAVHNAAAIASGMVRAGADIIALDGLRGSTGAAPKVIRDNVGIPIEMAVAAVDERLRREGIRNQASLIAAGGIRNSADVVKAIALGADAVYIGTAALIALGCTVCQQCHTGRCAWGICTSDAALTRRINPEIGARRLTNLLRGWELEIKEMLGGMGVNAIESLRGNRNHLRGVGMTQGELDTLGVRMAGT